MQTECLPETGEDGYNMDLSFWGASTGAAQLQTKLDTIANNIANINTFGYKSHNAIFADLLYDNIREPSGNESILRQGRGARVEKTDILFKQGAIQPTGLPLDFAITTDGFFAVENPRNGETYYTRDGSFQLSENINGEFNLITGSGYYVLDSNGQRIVVSDLNAQLDIGIYDFNHREGFHLMGNNLYQPVEKNGAVFLKQDAEIERGMLEMSGVDLPLEMARLIQTQRNFQMALRMVQTSDEIEGTVNNLRN